MPTREYSKRTEKNIRISDGTSIISHGPLRGGSALTEFLADKHQKPYIPIDLNKSALKDGSIMVNKWIHHHDIKVLNVAGPRASKDPKICEAAFDLLGTIFLDLDGRIP